LAAAKARSATPEPIDEGLYPAIVCVLIDVHLWGRDADRELSMRHGPSAC